MHSLYLEQWSDNLNKKLSLPSDAERGLIETPFQTHMTEWVCPRAAKNKHWWSAESKTRGNRTVSGVSEGRADESSSDVLKRTASYLVHRNLKTERGKLHAAEFHLEGVLYSVVQVTDVRFPQDQTQEGS